MPRGASPGRLSVECTGRSFLVTPEVRMSVKSRRCEICKGEIDPERLEFLPETRLCLTHAKLIEKYGGEFKISATQERTSKPGSLKRNYGGISTTSTRNTSAVERLRQEYEAN